jgi:two-component sensor histidine kinase/ABC-type amino acid transport substrate-binding protein
LNNIITKISFLFLYLFLGLNLFAQKIIFTEEEKNWIKNNKTVYFGYDPNWPPYEIYSNGKYSGVCADFIKIISKKTGIHFVPQKDLTWEKSFELIKNNELMMVPGAGITEERKKHLIFSDNYIKLPWVIVTKKENNKIKKIADLNFKKISIPKDYLQQEIIKRDFPFIKIISRKNFQECLEDVSTGISEATIGSLGTISYFINETGSTDLIIANYTHYNKYSVAFAFPKQQQILRNIVQKTLKSITYYDRNKIYSKWVSINFNNTHDNSKLWKYIIIGLSILCIIFIVILLWNKSLRKQIFLRKKIEIQLSKTLEKVNKQNQDKTILLQEIHHRVKNNLQIIISLLRLQSNSNPNVDTQNALNEAIDRINSISLVHEHNYKNPNLAEINLEAYIHNLGEELKRIFIKEKHIVFEINTNDIQLNIKSIIPLALILNELITNSLKYAFRNQIEGKIYILFNLKENQLLMEYFDNGEWFSNTYTQNFGTYLIEIFTEQLSGEMTKKDEKFASYLFKFDDF